MRLQPLVRGAARAAGSICPYQAHQACSVGSAPAAAACAASVPRRAISATAGAHAAAPPAWHSGAESERIGHVSNLLAGR
jgi:hypothetical protein